MSTLTALGLGLRRVNQVKRFILALYLCNLLLALVLGSIVYDALRADLATSLAGERMSEGFDSLWYDSFAAEATGTTATFTPSVAGAGAVFDALDAWLDGFSGLRFGPPGSGMQRLVVFYMLISCWFGAGFLAYFNRQLSNGTDGPSFFGDAARFFPRILLLTLFGLVLFGVIFGPLRSFIDARVLAATRDSIDERVHFAYTLAEYLLLWALVWSGALVLGFAKVTSVRQGSVSLVTALWQGMRRGVGLVIAHPVRAGGLYASLGLVWLALILLYTAFVPGAGTTGATSVALTFLFGQLFLGSRIALRAWVYASESALYAAIESSDMPESHEQDRDDIP